MNSKIPAKTMLAAFLVFVCYNASATSTLMQESSWHREDPTAEDNGGGAEDPSGTSSADLLLVNVGPIICGRFDSTIAGFQPKSDDVIFAGFRTANGDEHVYFVDEWWGEPDPGEADITQRGKTLTWAMTRTPTRGYLYRNAKLKPDEPDIDESFVTKLKLGCAEIAHDIGEVNKNNANEVLRKLNSAVSDR